MRKKTQNKQHERKNVISECVTSGYVPMAVSVPSYYTIGTSPVLLGTSPVLLALNLMPLFNVSFPYNNACPFDTFQRKGGVLTSCTCLVSMARQTCKIVKAVVSSCTRNSRVKSCYFSRWVLFRAILNIKDQT
jgi:hypothetical protein